MAKKPKLDLTPSGVGLNNPFAALEGSALPPAPAETPTAKAPAPTNANTIPGKPSKLGRVVLRREKAHRGGKTVIVVYDFAPNIGGGYIEKLAGKLKASCGCGGTVKERTIEVQGDQPGRVRALLEEEGFRVAGV